jgi:hypothetical protein
VRIPDRFQLGANTWTVKWDPTLLEKQKCYGLTHYDMNQITLQPPIRGKYKMQNVRQVFWHEMFHAMFLTLNKLKLSADEQLVDQLGHLVEQYLQTAERD